MERSCKGKIKDNMCVLKEPLNEWIEDVLNDEIIISSDVREEAQKNLWSFSLSFDEAEKLGNNDLILFINKIIKDRTAKLKHINQEMIFYLWHDEVAGKLCFSLIKFNTEFKLPFNIHINITNNITDIINDFLTSNYLEGIPKEELTDINLEIEHKLNEKTNSSLNVFCLKIPTPLKGEKPDPA